MSISFRTIIKKVFAIVFITMALFLLLSSNNEYIPSIYKNNKNIENKHLILYNYKLNIKICEFPIKDNDTFCISFIHSVNKTPVKDFYKFDENNDIIVYKTIYYSFGAGVETELENNETITYGSDGSMTIEHIDKKIDDLIYYLSSYYDHFLKIEDGEEININKNIDNLIKDCRIIQIRIE